MSEKKYSDLLYASHKEWLKMNDFERALSYIFELASDVYVDCYTRDRVHGGDNHIVSVVVKDVTIIGKFDEYVDSYCMAVRTYKSETDFLDYIGARFENIYRNDKALVKKLTKILSRKCDDLIRDILCEVYDDWLDDIISKADNVKKFDSIDEIYNKFGGEFNYISVDERENMSE